MMASFYNNSNRDVYLQMGDPVDNGIYTIKLAKSSYYELPKPIYTGPISGYWAVGGTGSITVTEYV